MKSMTSRSRPVSGDFKRSLVGNEVLDVKCQRDFPIRWNGDVVSIGIDFLAYSKWSSDARMELVGFLHCVTF